MATEHDVTIKIEAQNLVQAAIDAAIRSFNQLGDTTKVVADRLGNAFKTLDLKSAFDIGTERAKIISAYEQIAASGVATAGELNRARTAMQTKLGDLTAAEFSHINAQKTGQAAAQQTTQTMDGMFGKAGAGIIVFNQLTQIVQTAWQAINAAVEPALKMEKFNAVLKASTGSAEEAGYSMQFIGEQSKRLNTDLESNISAFARLATATRNTSMEGATTRQMFIGFAEAFSVLKLSTEQTNSAFAQITQGINKGKLELEDLKIIAEAGVPVFEMLSTAMGKSRPEIMKMISDGQLLAAEVYPKLAEQMHQTFGVAAVENASSATNSLTALKNELFLNAATIGNDLLPAFTLIVKAIGSLVEVGGFAVKTIQVVSSAFVGLGFAAVETGKLVTGGMFSAEGRATFAANMKGIVDVFLGDLDKMIGGSKTYHKTEAQLAAEKAESDRRRQKENLDAIAANTKAREEYTKTIADLATRETAKELAEYETRKKTVTAYYDAQLKAATKGSAEETALIVKRNADLERIEGERRTIKARVAIEVKDAALKAQATENAALIAEIEKGIALRTISETDGNAKILALRRELLDDEVALAAQRVSVLAASGMKGTEEYLKALDIQTRAQTAVNTAILAQTKATREAEVLAEKEALEKKKQLMAEEEAERAKRNEGALVKKQEIITAEMVMVGDFNAWFRSQWQAAIDEGTKLLQGLSTTVYNAFAAMNQLPLKLGEGFADAITLSKSLAAEAASIWQTEHENNLRWGGSLAGVFDKLTALKAEAKALAAAFYGEKAAADILTEALKASTGASAAQLDAIEQIINGFTRLDAKQLTGVRSEVERLRKALADLAQQSQDTLRALQDELDQMTGNVTAVELRAFEDKRVAILAQLDAAKKVNEQDAVANLTQALDILDTIYKTKVTDAVAEQKIDSGLALNRLNNAKTEADFRALSVQKNAKTEIDLATANHQAIMTQYDAQTRARQTLANLGEKARTGMAWGGKLPGGDSRFDTVPVMARPGEWFIRNESAGFWGDGFMSGINEPLSAAGRQIAAMMSGMVPTMPRLAFANGGRVGDGVGENNYSPLQDRGSLTVNIYPQRMDEATVRREVIPVLEKYTRLKA